MWGPWIHECVQWMMDADGAYVHFIHPGGLGGQPAYDMHVYDVIRGKWVTLRNEEIRRGQKR